MITTQFFSDCENTSLGPVFSWQSWNIESSPGNDKNPRFAAPLANLIQIASTEGIRTLLLGPCDRELKKRYSRTVYRFLSKKYESIGGIHQGKGFKDENDMLDSIPVWRLRIMQNRVVSVMMFKIKEFGKKMVAYACADELEGEFKKSDFTYMLNESYAELSDGLLICILKTFSSLLHHYILRADHLMAHKTITPLSNKTNEDSIPDDSKRLFFRLKSQYPDIIKFFYIRKIGNRRKLKVLLGTPESPLIHHAFKQAA